MNVHYVKCHECHTYSAGGASGGGGGGGVGVKIFLVICYRGNFEVLAGLLFRTTNVESQ